MSGWKLGALNSPAMTQPYYRIATIIENSILAMLLIILSKKTKDHEKTSEKSSAFTINLGILF